MLEVPSDVSSGVPMSAPTVCAVMLANGRPEMAERAKRSFFSQSCEFPKSILIFNNNGDKPICTLRNLANAQTDADIIIHWDSDDWSHPNRIAEQAALLQSSGAECVGYSEMLFWRVAKGPSISDARTPYFNRPGAEFSEAWLYRASVPNYAIGTSMCYWRETWGRNPFPDRSEGCDDLDWFNRGVKIESVPAVGFVECRMIASIHGGNTCSRIDATKREWQRVPEWDAYCREAMKL